MFAVISADVVSSTSLPNNKLIKLTQKLNECLADLEGKDRSNYGTKYEGWGRIVRGDTIEYFLEHPEDAFEVAILLKAWTKAIVESKDWKDTDGEEMGASTAISKNFSKYGLRIAIGIGGMKTFDRTLNIIDGEAIYRSGRALNNLSGYDKYAITISMENEEVAQTLQVIMALVNQILNKATPRKCETLYYRLLYKDSYLTADKMNITVSGVNQTLNDLGWSAIEGAIQYYRKVTSKL